MHQLYTPSFPTKPKKKLQSLLAGVNKLHEIHLSDCFLHLSQSYMREINELGPKVTYETNHNLALALKIVPSLAFEKKIGNFYDMIVQEI